MPALAHPLTGPLEVRGAEPGDLLELEVLGYETDDFAWTAIWPGSGFLGDLFAAALPGPLGARPAAWRAPAELPGVAVPACVHAGTIGVAPSRELFERAPRARGRRSGAANPPSPDR